MMRKIKAIVKRADEPIGHMTWISDTLENLQKHVGGYIETVTLPGGVVVICDEEGRLKGYEHCCTIFPSQVGAIEFVGEIVVVGTDGDEFGDIPIDFQTWKQIYLEKGVE
jgi:hypothetical protein